jgi:hypothetical protein
MTCDLHKHLRSPDFLLSELDLVKQLALFFLAQEGNMLSL